MRSFIVCPTNSLRSENLGETGREGDEDYGVGDPGQILEEHVAVQTAVHPLLCCGHTDKEGKRVNHESNAHKQVDLNTPESYLKIVNSVQYVCPTVRW